MNQAHWVHSLETWYMKNARAMPWRKNPSPYFTWVSEVMLQQTQVDTVIPYFHRFIENFPTIQALADAPLQNVLKCWEGLGYYSRARNFHKAASVVTKTLDGVIPSRFEDLCKLPGLGPYCSAAIASISFGEAVPVVDGNVLRVFTRFWGIDTDIRQPSVRKDIFAKLTPFIKKANPSYFNQAIMELGATVCRPQKADCNDCPLTTDCYSYLNDCVADFPVKSKAKPVPHYEIGVGVIWKDDKILIAKRKETQMLGGLWEFPGGKRKKGESLSQTVLREIKEETGLTVTLASPYCTVNHAYTHFKITLTAFRCDYVSGQAKPKSSDEIKWILVDEFDDFPFPTANKKVIAAIQNPK